MKKILLKKVLSILDTIEMYGIDYAQALVILHEKLMSEQCVVERSELGDILTFLKKRAMIKDTKNGIDLCPTATIFSKSNQNSGIEALSLFESLLHIPSILEYTKEQLPQNLARNKEEVLHNIDKTSFAILTQTTLFELVDDTIRFTPKLRQGILDITNEFTHKKPLLSTTLTALYTSSIVKHENLEVPYRNEDRVIASYPYKHIILSIIPRKGIPRDRDETKALQSFYKDTLFHEFDRECPICKINIPHMLVASHIKPFRDCAHIFEAIDHSNGLLLCRNHDYLFDQGYISFDLDGKLLICDELLEHKDMKTVFGFAKDFILPEVYLTENRQLFFKYHRENIFKR